MNKKQTIRLNEAKLNNIVSKIVKESVNKMLKENINYNISTVEDLCNIVGETIEHEIKAQQKIESILLYLCNQGVINEYNEDKLDWLFSDAESY